jgi:hypothetical protein
MIAVMQQVAFFPVDDDATDVDKGFDRNWHFLCIGPGNPDVVKKLGKDPNKHRFM